MASASEQSAADKEAFEYWGYLFKSDKTGTEKLKKLLRALYKLIGAKFEPSDSRDLTPSQLAQFYRELNGNYDQLFLSVPPATIAFIYKNLGCLHSLQPLPSSAADNRFTDPIIPALKVEGWIMWETIQLLLGPEEHAGFLMMAVQKWELKDPDTGDRLPTVLPRSCFPVAPDAHMTAWYDGMGERLRREAEEEQSMRITAIDEEPRRQIESGERSHRRHERDHSRSSEEEPPTDTKRSSALAYFKNPLFRNHEGRPGVVRRNSKHPTLVSRGMSAATSVGYVVRNIGSPHLWDGGNVKDNTHRDRERSHGHREKERERERERDRDTDHERDRDRRRKSLPHANRASQEYEDDMPSPRLHPRQAALSSRRGSATNSPASDRDQWESNGSQQGHTPTERHHHRQASSPADHTIRHSKSHDPTPSPKDYFPPYEAYRSRRGSAHGDAPSPGATPEAGRTPSLSRGQSRERDAVHTGFMPTASPLFATQVARSDHRGPQSFHPPNYIPRSSGNERYESPGRSPMGRSGSVRRDNSVRRDSARPLGSSPPGMYGPNGANVQRPKVARFETPVTGGGQGRPYAKEGAYR
ncbi:hypothetical protein K461DRAFT_279114 [Myriangium duriaei CBS 260.36]|uniref:DUF7514 domain-containing protein n=1 Tax=Myriangium duriaei CBS 260.36 TaxID=1168546 RepID=A0A9P4J1L9_9PEZI|nr:hypothetical protein K461DRAFT_279114 [Myriangium duriaei CBS 260.36]